MTTQHLYDDILGLWLVALFLPGTLFLWKWRWLRRGAVGAASLELALDLMQVAAIVWGETRPTCS
jgi:hypothetical protein